jgi:L-amino acid N-acyltransferase YncA
MDLSLVIRAATAAQVAEIYNHSVLTSTITFEEEPVTSKEAAGASLTSKGALCLG